MKELTQGRSLSSVNIAEKLLVLEVTALDMKGFTLEKNLTNADIVTNHS